MSEPERGQGSLGGPKEPLRRRRRRRVLLPRPPRPRGNAGLRAAAAARPLRVQGPKPFFKAWAVLPLEGSSAIPSIVPGGVLSRRLAARPAGSARPVSSLNSTAGSSPSDSHCSRGGSLPDGFLCFGEASGDWCWPLASWQPVRVMGCRARAEGVLFVPLPPGAIVSMAGKARANTRRGQNRRRWPPAEAGCAPPEPGRFEPQPPRAAREVGERLRGGIETHAGRQRRDGGLLA